MSNILKPAGYHLNVRNGEFANFGDYINIEYDIAPRIHQDPTSVDYLWNTWLFVDSSVRYPTSKGENVFVLNNFGNRILAVLFHKSNQVVLQVGQWETNGPIPPSFVGLSCDIPLNKWVCITCVSLSPYDDMGGGVLLFVDGSPVGVPIGVGGTATLNGPPDGSFTISASGPLGVPWDETDYAIIDCPLPFTISDFSMFFGEYLDLLFEDIAEFVYNNGRGADASDFGSLHAEDVMFTVSLRDGWMNTRAPWKGRNFYFNGTLCARGFFGAVANTTSRLWRGLPIRSSRDLYLSHTRSDNKFVQRAIPAFDHQNAWVARSVPVTDFPDAEGI